MKKSLFSKILVFIFVCGLLVPLTASLQSCGKPKFNKPRNGGKRINSSGKVGLRKDRNRHVWGK